MAGESVEDRTRPMSAGIRESLGILFSKIRIVWV